jgi:hypothetical protein
MTEERKGKIPISERKKWMLVGVLAVVLGVLVTIRVQGKTSSGRAVPPAEASGAVRRAGPPHPSAATASEGEAPAVAGDEIEEALRFARGALARGEETTRLPERDLFAARASARAARAPREVPTERERREQELRRLHLQAIFRDGANGVALLNGERLREGETIGRFTLARVEENRVLLTCEGETFVVSMDEH